MTVLSNDAIFHDRQHRRVLTEIEHAKYDRGSTALIRNVLLLVFIVSSLSGRASATDAYALRESKACQYCHVSASPGLLDSASGLRQKIDCNQRGLYYAAHNYSFAGYRESRTANSSLPPTFHLAWREVFTDSPRRIAVADVVGDGIPSLISLNERAGSQNASVLTVRRWNGQSFVVAFTTNVSASADKLAVGRFAGSDKPAVIVTSAGIWYWNGKTFAHKAAQSNYNLFGTSRLKDGSERLLIANTPDKVGAWRVDPNAVNQWLYDPVDSERLGPLQRGDMHETQIFFNRMQVQEQLSQGGIIGRWEIEGFGRTFVYYPTLIQGSHVKADGRGNTAISSEEQSWSVTLVDPNPMPVKRQDGAVSATGLVYYTPTLKGQILDIGLESDRGDKQPGLLVLTGDTPGSKTRILYFFALDNGVRQADSAVRKASENRK